MNRVKMRFSGAVLNLLAVFFIIGGLAVDYSFAKSDNIYEEIQRFDKVLIEIDKNYVEEVDAADLVDAAISGMREDLDPHTAYFEKDDYDELMIHTNAEFGGLGITISIRDNILTVVSPLPGTPASLMGIKAGDKILKIDGKTTEGITVEEAVKKLRGKSGTQVTITIAREGEKGTIDYTITRAVIHINSIPYAGMILDSIGYIRLVSFSKESGKEVEDAIKKISAKKLKGMILDLRDNPGGLLPAAIDVAGKFIGKDKLVVYTRGRMPEQSHEYDNPENPVLNEDIPLVVLVNEGSASASEIVAGAIQDWDRGVVVGRDTYGKGSVQTVLPLNIGKNRYLKLTTAYYYTPSGRCINKPENGVHSKKKKKLDSDEEGDSAAVSTPKDTAKVDSTKAKKEIFKTKGGRIVYGGGGITPDVKLELPRWLRFEEVLERKSLFFKYAIKTLAKLKEKGIGVTDTFEVKKDMMDDFKKFVGKEKVEYEIASEKALQELELSFNREYGDSALQKGNQESISKFKKLIQDLKTTIAKEKENDFSRSELYIKRAIKRELLAGASGEEARFKYILSYDQEVEKAKELFSNAGHYHSLLSAVK